MPVFSLEEVRALQVKNISQNNFKYWPESATYGYFGGGFAPPGICTITRLDFSNETVSDPGKNLPAAAAGLAAVSSSSYGYFGGGSNPPTTRICTITRLDFSNETVSNPGKNLPTSRDLLAATSSSSYGYFGGGYTPPNINTITRLDFSNETVSDPGKNLPTARRQSATISSSSYGYFGGGYTPPFITTITKLDFSNETVSNPEKNLPVARREFAGTSSQFYGYFGGGSTPPNINTITRLDFSNETVSDPGKNLPTVRIASAATSSSSYGYFGGGFTPPPTINTISRLDFSNETVSASGNNLPTSRGSLAALSGGQSINRGSKTYGYFLGGTSTPPPTFHSTITRLDFSNETVSNPTKNLLETNSNFSSVANNYYGYNAGGYAFPPVPFAYKNTISRLDFSNETINLPGKNLPLGRSGPASVTSSSYGYFGGGYIALPPGIYFCTIIRLDFSNETVSDPGKNFPSGRSSIASVTSSSYGYFVNGFNVDPGYGNYINTISRLDFSSETISIPSNSFPSIKNNSKTVSNSSFGYFGGANDGLASNVISRLDFSNETVSDPGKNLPQTRFYGAATSSSFYGYFAGGNIVSPATTYNTIMRLDFSTENASLSANNLPAARTDLSAVSNSN